PPRRSRMNPPRAPPVLGPMRAVEVVVVLVPVPVPMNRVGVEVTVAHEDPVVHVDRVARRHPHVARVERRPADRVGTMPPRHPGGGPDVARHPEPADTDLMAPPPVVVGGPAGGLVG